MSEVAGLIGCLDNYQGPRPKVRGELRVAARSQDTLAHVRIDSVLRVRPMENGV